MTECRQPIGSSLLAILCDPRYDYYKQVKLYSVFPRIGWVLFTIYRFSKNIQRIGIHGKYRYC